MPAIHLVVNEPAGDQEEQLSGLAQRAGEGDESAFVRLVQRLEHRIRHWAGSLSDDADSADDLAQLTLIRMHERVAQFDSRSRLTSWLYGMMRNLAADRRRADWRRTVREQRAASELMVTAAACDADGARDERLALLLASYHTVLTSREREVFELVDLHGTPAAEAAARLHIVPSTARVLLLRARRKVRLLMLRDAENIEGDSR